MIRGQPKLLRNEHIDRFKDTYAETNLNFVQNKWQQPGKPKIKIKTLKHHNKLHKEPLPIESDSESEDEDCDSLFAKN